MRYDKLSYIEFYSSYLEQCLSIDLFSYWTPGRGQKAPMNKVYPSFCPEVFLELAGIGCLVLKLRMVLGTHVVLCMTEPEFFAPKMEKIGQA